MLNLFPEIEGKSGVVLVECFQLVEVATGSHRVVDRARLILLVWMRRLLLLQVLANLDLTDLNPTRVICRE